MTLRRCVIFLLLVQAKRRSPWLVYGLPVTISFCVAVCCGIFTRYSEPSPVYARLAEQWLASGPLHQSFLPVGYTLFLIVGKSTMFGVFGLQCLAYVGSVLLITALTWQFRGGSLGAMMAGSVGALNPQIFLSVNRCTDTLVAVLFLLAVVYSFLYMGRSTPRALTWTVFGLISGFACSVRPNMFVLVLLLLLLSIRSQVAKLRWRCVTFGCFAAGVAVLTVGIISSIVNGTYVIVPDNGAYNLFAGSNAYSARYLRTRLNAEDSIPIALSALGYDGWANANDLNRVSTRSTAVLYRTLSLDYLKSSPGCIPKLIALKLAVLLSPDYRREKASRTGRIAFAAKILCAAPPVVWLCAIAAWHRNATQSTVAVTLIALAYIIPFLITNSDPRFRVPLDCILVAHAAALMSIRLREVRATGDFLSCPII